MLSRFKKIQQVLLYVLFLNLAVAFAKIAYGTFTSTLSMTADGYHSLFDGISNIVGMVGIFIASRPPDREHPYGHQKYETFAAIFIALLLIFVGFEIFQSALERFLVRNVPEVTSLSFLVMLGTMGINYLVTRYELRQGISLKSQVLIADSMHTRSDIYVSLSVIISLAASKLGFPLLDPVVALLISLVILRAGYRIIRQSSETLLDMSRLDEDEVCELVLGVEGVLGCHKVRTRGSIGDIRIDMHLLLRPDMPIEEAHLISHNVSKLLKAEYEGVSEVIVHIEPATPLPQESNSKKTS
ncbi:cation transporter [Methanosarcina sp. KYL-1]|uniref:cation diffusion facilitator family transporter n=1 Tax=Methanosarcina sp. KYL-1 TaxID=2602068 RepID=UPI0021010A83|nr:cation diffusion facilitator family transporter [Methanosarcina sp. KYL-1]MCQ1534557.1 cation transporter [Methanosarcina sp. KYL-1]